MEAIKLNMEELIAKSAKALSELDAKVKERNAAVYDGKSAEAVGRIESEIEDISANYANLQKLIVFETAAASEDPMMYAITHPSYTIQKVTEDRASTAMVKPLVLEPVERTIDLLQLHKHIPDGIGVNKQWPYMVEALNAKLTARVAQDIGLNPTEIVDSYAMSAIARDIDLGKNPTSNTNMLKTMRFVVAAMVGEEYTSKVLSHDVAYLLMGYAKKSRKALSLTVSNHKTLRATMMDVCRHVVNGESYSLDYKKRKDQAPSKHAGTVDQAAPAEIPAVPAA